MISLSNFLSSVTWLPWAGRRRGSRRCEYIEVNQNRHCTLLLNIYEAAPDGEHYTIDGIDCYLTNEPDKEYQFIIYDCGVMQTPTSIFHDADHRLLCGVSCL